MVQARVMTYNIFMGGRKGAALHEVVRGVAPDVLLVNESPKTPILWKRQCNKLAEKWGMRFAGGGRKAGSNMVAVGRNVQVKSVHASVFKTPMFKPRRGVIAVQLRAEGRLFGAVSCHLSLGREQRLEEIEQVIEAANRLRGPVVVAGDLNERPGGPSWKRLREVGFVDHGTNDWLTFPAREPETRIDALLVRGNATVSHHGDPGVPIELQQRASDHRGVLAVLDF
jgi:endonuclease/exonuclease/phosphatase family metal-dependent hydrolase